MSYAYYTISHPHLQQAKIRFIELFIFEFVRRDDLWSPAKCFDFVGNLVIILQFRHCRFTTMTGRPQVAPTVLYDKLLDKSEFDAKVPGNRGGLFPGGVVGDGIGEGIRH